MFCTLLKALSSRDRGTQLELQHLPKAVIRYNTEIKSHLHLFTTTDKSHLCITDWFVFGDSNFNVWMLLWHKCSWLCQLHLQNHWWKIVKSTCFSFIYLRNRFARKSVHALQSLWVYKVFSNEVPGCLP